MVGSPLLPTCPHYSLSDEHSEFNYWRDSTGKCVLVEGAEPLESEATCAWDQEFWFERTNLRKIPYSKCEGGLELDKGSRHLCPSAGGRGFFFWATVIVAPLMLAGLFGVWWTRRRGGAIRLHDSAFHSTRPRGDGILSTLASVPWWLIGVAGAVAAWFDRTLSGRFSSRRGGYRHLAVDDDAELLAECTLARFRNSYSLLIEFAADEEE